MDCNALLPVSLSLRLSVFCFSVPYKYSWIMRCQVGQSWEFQVSHV
jgi:hypothetical protein